MKKAIVAAVCAAVCVGALTLSLLARCWWSYDGGSFTKSYGIQSVRTCATEGGECSTLRYVSFVAGLGEIGRDADTHGGWSSDLEKEDYMRDLGRIESFASYGLVASIAGILLALSVGLGAILGLARRSSGARVAGWAAILAAVVGVVCAFLFYRAEPFNRARVKAGVGMPLYLGGAVAGVVGAALLARTRPRWQEIAEEDEPQQAAG